MKSSFSFRLSAVLFEKGFLFFIIADLSLFHKYFFNSTPKIHHHSRKIGNMHRTFPVFSNFLSQVSKEKQYGTNATFNPLLDPLASSLPNRRQGNLESQLFCRSSPGSFPA